MKKINSPSVQRNKDPIYEVLKQYLRPDTRLIEIGSGTGEHAIYFGEKFPSTHWVTTDTVENLSNITAWLQEAKLKNVHGPEKLKVGEDDFPGKRPFDYVFTANTLHIMSWKEDKSFFKLIGKRLREGCLAFIYGPFNYGGNYTSDSNREFDGWLKNRDEKSGIRNFEDVESNMKKAGFKLLKDHEMPANNRLLVFERLPF